MKAKLTVKQTRNKKIALGIELLQNIQNSVKLVFCGIILMCTGLNAMIDAPASNPNAEKAHLTMLTTWQQVTTSFRDFCDIDIERDSIDWLQKLSSDESNGIRKITMASVEWCKAIKIGSDNLVKALSTLQRRTQILRVQAGIPIANSCIVL